MKTLLICHDGVDLNQEGLGRWLASFSVLKGIIILKETNQQKWRRIWREIQRVGLFRFFDVVAMRIYYKVFLYKKDRDWQNRQLHKLCSIYPEIPKNTQVLYTHSPNSKESEEFISKMSPDIMIARCKRILKDKIFTIPTKGTFVLHPGICPEYRNAYGCFWALANDELDKVGMTLLKVDKGVDTGPVYGYYGYKYDEVNESHAIIMWKVVLDNLNKIQKKLEEIYIDHPAAIDISGRPSGMWGQPWLTQYLKWKYKARRRRKSECLVSGIS
jgi:hypothetical protein